MTPKRSIPAAYFDPPPPPAAIAAGTSKPSKPLTPVDPRSFDKDLTTQSTGGGLGGPGERIQINGTGLALVDSVGGAGKVYVRFGGRGGWIPFKEGSSRNPIPYEFIELKWAAQAAITVTLEYWTDPPDSPLEIT